MNNAFICGTKFSDMSKVPEVKVNKSYKIPKTFNLSKNLYDVINQGNKGICASVSLTDSIKYLENFKKINHNLSRDYFYKNRKDKKIDGMQIYEAMEFAKKNKYISLYGKLQDIESIKIFLVTQGPVILGLPVFNYEDQFWKDGEKLLGGHAVVLVGYNEKGFILKNSWGKNYGKSGYITFPYEDFKYVKEAWIVYN